MNTLYLFNNTSDEAMPPSFEAWVQHCCDSVAPYYQTVPLHNLSEVQALFYDQTVDAMAATRHDSGSTAAKSTSALFWVCASSWEKLMQRVTGLRTKVPNACILGFLPEGCQMPQAFDPQHNWQEEQIPPLFDVYVVPTNLGQNQRTMPSATELLTRNTTLDRYRQLYEEVQSLSYQDNETKLYNYTYFLQRFNSELAMCKRKELATACVILGVNYYQVYLDSYGYEFSVQLLCHVAQVVKRVVRQEDVVARLNEDEIAVLLPQSSDAGARVVMRRLKEALEEKPFCYNGIEENLTIHMGIAGYPCTELDGESDVEDANSLIRFARHALQSARFDGGDDITLFTDIRPNLCEVEEA